MRDNKRTGSSKPVRNPLTKRLPRELKQDLGKYLAIFLFLILSIGFVSGFLVAGSSMKTAYNESFEKYNVEDGNFRLAQEASDQLIETLEAEDIQIYENFYIEAGEADKNHEYRIYETREEINKISLHEGALPKQEDEVAIDRLYAANNDLDIGDRVTVAGKTWEICGLVAFSDYTSLYKNNSDFVFDAQEFTVAAVTHQAFEGLMDDTEAAAGTGAGDEGLHYVYSWTDRETNLTDDEKYDKAEDLKALLVEEAILSGNQVTGFLAEQDNQAIHFAGNDLGRDRQMIIWLMYIVIVILAFVFAVTTANTIEKEATVIGTLRASGYTRGELLRHYMILPIVVTLIACIIGNILGYTLFKDLVADLYYGSYSLPPYRTIWNPSAFLLTTVSPAVIMLIINFLILKVKLTVSPLAFLRGITRKEKRGGAVRLPGFRFFTRFRLRIILQNKAGYIILFVGIFFANVLLMFGMMFTPLLDHYQERLTATMACEYQYVLKAPIETDNQQAEKYAMRPLDYQGEITDEITAYGLEEDSRYLTDADTGSLKAGEVIVSDGFMEKQGLAVGDEIRLEEQYEDKAYTFTVAGSMEYTSSLAVFVSREEFNELFDYEDSYYTGYFSDEKLEDIDEDLVASVITEEDLDTLTTQMDASLGSVFPMIGGFAIITYILLLYVLSKIVIERNSRAISMVKILGYRPGEISRLYSYATAMVVVLSLLISLPLVELVMESIYRTMMKLFAGWLDFYLDPVIYVKMVVICLALYALFSLILMRKIKKVPMDEALKNVE
ncbi:MAG: ABC transporter permease [Bacillota bacterium]|nr:ABC transporter permease [Bacillota bacterium]